MPNTVLVTGGTGYVASWCLAQLLQRGDTARTTIRSAAKEANVRKMMAKAGADTAKLEFAVADLTSDDGWDAAMAGVDYVLHVASPLGNGDSSNPDDLIIPAREGALRVLRAAVKAGVKRVVLTSSAAACNPGSKTDSFTDETVWTDPKLWNTNAYRLSKLLSERAAWEFMEAEGGQTELVTILPTGIFGPVLTKDNLGSVQMIDRLLTGSFARIPGFGVCIIDVRDLADAHIKAMLTPAAVGERLLITGDFMWMKEIAQTLHDRLGAKASKVPTKLLPDFMLRLAANFQPELRAVTPLLGRKTRYNWAKAERILGFKPRPAPDTVIDTANSLLAD